MSRGQLTLLVLAAVLAGGTLGALTAPASPEPTHDAASRELVVFETADCVYCRLFRRDVLQEFMASGRAGDVPIRFADANDATPLAPILSSPLTVVPTTVLLVDGREAGRITGYAEGRLFNQMVSHMLPTD